MRIAVITKSFSPDYELCAALNRSVLENSPATVEHHIIVPQSDLKLFSRLAGPRTRIRCDAEFLPSNFVHVPFSNITVNLSKPYPPVRGWIQQQIVKLAAVANSDCDAVVTADSDVEFIRPFDADTFVRDGAVRFFRKLDQIDERLPRQIIWHRVAHTLLGLPPEEPPFPDYISSPLAWNPIVAQQMFERIESVTGKPWYTALAGRLDFSECVLYGVFADNVCGPPANSFASDDALCLPCWASTPLNLDTIAALVRDVRPTDIAAFIQSKSRTSKEVREAAFAALRSAHAQKSAVTAPAKDA